MAAPSQASLREHLKNIDTQLANKKAEYSEALQQLQAIVSRSLVAAESNGIEHRSSAVNSNGATADTDINGSEPAAETQSAAMETTLSAEQSRGLMEMLTQVRRTCWASDHICRASSAQVQEWMNELLNKVSNNQDKELHRQVLIELLQLRDCSAWNVKPALAVRSRAELPGAQITSGISSGAVLSRRQSAGSVDSFFDTEDEHISKTWKELCQVLDVSLKAELHAALEAAQTVQAQVVDQLIACYHVIATSELVWHRWTQARQVKISEYMSEAGEITPGKLKERMQMLISALDHLMDSLPLDLNVAVMLSTKSPLDMLLDLHGRHIMAELSRILKSMDANEERLDPDGKHSNSHTTATTTTASNSSSNGGARNRPQVPVSHDAPPSNGFTQNAIESRMSKFVTTSETTAAPSSCDRCQFRVFCDLISRVERYAQQVHSLLEHHGHHVGHNDTTTGIAGSRDSRKPPSPRPNLQRAMHQQFAGRSSHMTTGDFSLVEEDEEDASAQNGHHGDSGHSANANGGVAMPTDDMASDSFTTPATTSVGNATLRHSRERWKWSSELESKGEILSQQLTASISESGHLWFSAESARLQKFRSDQLFNRGAALSPASQCLSEAAISFFSESIDYLTVPNIQLPSSFSAWKPKTAFTEAVEEAVTKVLNLVKEVIRDVPDHYSSTALFYCWSLVTYCLHHVTGFNNKIGGKQSTHRHAFIASKSQLKKLKLELSSAIHLQEKKKLAACLYDDDSQDWANQKAYFKDEKSSYPMKHFCLGIYALLYKLECCGKFCQRDSSEMMAGLLSTFLSQLSSRYSHTRPTERRVALFRSDIGMLLATVGDVIWTLVPRASKPCGEPGQSVTFATANVLDIHQSCTLLYTTLVAVTSPIAAIAADVKRAFSDNDVTGHTGQFTSQEKEEDEDAGQTVSDESQLVGLPSVETVQWLIDLHSNNHDIRRCVVSALWSWRCLSASHATDLSATSSVLTAMAADNFKLPRLLVSLAVAQLGSMSANTRDSQSTAVESNASQFDAFNDILWPLHAILRRSGQSTVLSLLLEHSRDEVIKFLSTPTTLQDPSHAPLWFRCVFQELHGQIVNNLPSLLVDMTFKLSDDKPIIPKLPCGCQASPVKDLSPKRVAQEVISYLLTDVRSALSAGTPICQLLTADLVQEDSESFFLAVLAQFITIMIHSTYRAERVAAYLPGEVVRKELISEVWSVLSKPREQCQGGSDVPQSENLRQLLVQAVKSNVPSASPGVLKDCWQQDVCLHFDIEDHVKTLQAVLTKLKRILPSTAVSGDALNKQDVDDYLRKLRTQNRSKPSISQFSPIAVVADLDKLATGSSLNATQAWSHHIKNALQISDRRLIMELLNNRFEIWDHGSSVSSESGSSVQQLRDVLNMASLPSVTPH